jgi:hypothetical protein
MLSKIGKRSPTIPELKRDLKAAVEAYRAETDGMDCGNLLAQVINPRAAVHAAKANECARRLKAIDERFPKDWVNL